MMEILEELNYNEHGLLPAIVQDTETNEVLMMAYMSKDSLKATLETGKTHFWSRSRKKLWMKGETSGHVQRVEEVRYDCDRDTLLIKVHQEGGACHEGYRSCFFRRVTTDGKGSEVVGERIFDPSERYGK